MERRPGVCFLFNEGKCSLINRILDESTSKVNDIIPDRCIYNGRSKYPIFRGSCVCPKLQEYLQLDDGK